MANISISIEGIDQAIENLKYRTGSIKQKMILAIRSYYKPDISETKIHFIDTDDLIRSIWDVGNNVSKLRSKRRNFSSLRSSINADLEKLSKKGMNDENIIIADSNLFDMSEEAKNELLNSFSDAVKTGDIDLDQATALLKTITDFLETIQMEDSETDTGNLIDQIKKVLNKLTGDVFSQEDLEEIGLNENEEIEEDELLDEDVEEIELDEDEEIEEIDADDLLDEDVEEIELDEDEEIEEIDLDEDEELEEVDEDDLLDDEVEEIELDEDEEIEEIDEDDLLDEDVEEIELDEDEEIEEIDLDEDEELEEVDEDDLLDDEVEEIELDEDEEIEEIDEDDLLDEDVEEIELDEDEEIEEIDLDEDEELEEVDELDEEEFNALEEFREKRQLAEHFDTALGEREKKFNQYVTVPKGLYTIGTQKGFKASLELQQFEMPKVYIAVYPVTNSLFEIFIEETGFITTAEKTGSGRVYTSRFKKDGKETVWSKSAGSRDIEGANWFQPAGPGSNLHGKRNHPVVQVSVEDAMAFASWIGRRIPTEAEWESAARTDMSYKYPWGNQFNPSALNIENSGICDTSSVDEYHLFSNEFNIADMLGNVLEWTSDMEYPSVKTSKKSQYCIAKGAAWNAKEDVSISSRALFKPGFTSNIIGFRCISEVFL